MWLEQHRQAMLHLHLSDQQVYCLQRCDLITGLTVVTSWITFVPEIFLTKVTTPTSWRKAETYVRKWDEITVMTSCYVISITICIYAHTRKLLPGEVIPLSCSGGRFKNAYELLNPRALNFSPVNKIHIFQFMDKPFCVEFQGVPLKFHTKYITHTLKDDTFLRAFRFKSSYTFLNPPPPPPTKSSYPPLSLLGISRADQFNTTHPPERLLTRRTAKTTDILRPTFINRIFMNENM